MENINPKSLTIGTFSLAMNNPSLKVKAVLQNMGIRLITHNSSCLYLISLSDGFFIEDFVIEKSIEESILQKVNLKDILKVEFINAKVSGQPDLLLLGFEPYLKGVDAIIGRPRLKSQTGSYVTSEGDNTIPAEILKKEATNGRLTHMNGKNIQSDHGIKEEIGEATHYKKFHNEFSDNLIKRERVEEEPLYNRIRDLKYPDKSWVIKARVLQKSEKKGFKNNTGDYFSLILKDNSGIIRATFFKEAAEKFFKLLKENSVYSFTGGDVHNGSNYNTTTNKYEIVFKERKVEVTELYDDGTIGKENMMFTKLSDLPKISNNIMINTTAIVKDSGEPIMKEVKTGGTKEWRKILIGDESGFETHISVWGQDAFQVELKKGCVYQFKGIKVKFFNEKYLLWENTTTFSLNADDGYKKIEDSKKAYNLPKDNGIFEIAEFKKPFTSNFLCLDELVYQSEEYFKDTNNQSKKLYFDFVAYLGSTKKNICYESCVIKNCKKKVIKDMKDSYRCERCNVEIERPRLRFMADLMVSDFSGTISGRVFGDENCLALFGLSIEEVNHMRLSDEEKFFDLLRETYHKEFYFSVIAKIDTYQSERRLAFEIIRIFPVEKSLDKIISHLINSI